MGADTLTLSGVEQDFYEKGISEGVNNLHDLKDWFTRETADYNGGAGHVWSHHHGRNASPFWGNEDSAYPVAGNQTHSKGRIGMKKITARIRMTVEAMDDLGAGKASFVNAMMDEKTRLIDDLSRRENHSLGMDGRGVLALVDEADPDGNTTLELDAPGNIAGDNFGNRFIDVGMFLAFINPANGALRTQAGAQAKVTAVNSDGTDVTLSTATIGTDVANSDYVVQCANAAVTDVLDTSFEAAAWGLPALIDDGTNRDNYFGILRTQVESLKSYVVSSTGALSMDVAQRTSDVVFNKLGGVITDIAMHTSTRREWLKLTDADRRYTKEDLRNPDPSTKAFTQGDITVDGVAIKALRSVGLDQVYFVDRKKAGFKQFVAEPGRFMDKDGNMWVREGTGTSARHAYEATYYRRYQNFATAPGVNARWDGVTGQTLVVQRDL